MIELNLKNDFIDPKAEAAFVQVCSGELAMSDWACDDHDKEDLDAIKNIAANLKERSKMLVVCGIGGSYIGVKAGLDFMGKPTSDAFMKNGEPEILFAGFNLSSLYHARLFESLRKNDKDFSVAVISKSGTTIEPAFVFSALKDILIEKHGAGNIGDKIVAITDAKEGALRAEAERENYATLAIPSGIGGRYSVLTPVGLLAFAFAGIDISEALRGAALAKAEGSSIESVLRLASLRAGKITDGLPVEILGSFEPSLSAFIDWLVQLYGESEGKRGLGIFPVKAIFTRDLHSIGQFLQEGNPIFLETFFSFAPEVSPEIRVKTAPAEANYAKKTMVELNEAARLGTIRAHRARGTEVTDIILRENSALAFGYAVRFFSLVSAVTGLLTSVNPFDQPGVEAYKREMKKLL